jgi:hypothetical protein
MGVVMASDTYLTPPQVAARLKVKADRVVLWIKSGQLRGFNVGDGTMRPRFRVFETDLQLFLESRAASIASTPRRRQRKSGNVIKFF